MNDKGMVWIFKLIIKNYFIALSLSLYVIKRVILYFKILKISRLYQNETAI